MARYFKIVEIDRDSFIDAAGEDLDYYAQIAIPTDNAVFAAIDESIDEGLSISMNCFDVD